MTCRAAATVEHLAANCCPRSFATSAVVPLSLHRNENVRGTEDYLVDDDWLDRFVCYLQDDTLIQCMPLPRDANDDGAVTGRNDVRSPVAGPVRDVRIEHPTAGANVVIDITSTFTGRGGHAVTHVKLAYDAILASLVPLDRKN